MTTNVKEVLNKICNNEIFNHELYFIGGTALAYYLNHRISEDIDIVSSTALRFYAHRFLVPNLQTTSSCLLTVFTYST